VLTAVRSFLLVVMVSSGCSGVPASVTATEAPSAPAPVRELAVGFDHACALLESGDVWCWGNNVAGQTGAPRAEVRSPWIAARVPGLSRASAIAAHDTRTCVIVEGAVECFGGGGFERARVPVDARSIAMGGYGTCVVRRDGSIACLRPDGSLRDEAAGLGNLTVAVGASHLCAIRADRRVACWGRNILGALAVDLPFAASTDTPVDVLGVERIRALQAGAHSTCALADDGRLWCWGALDDTPIDTADPSACDSGVRCTKTPVLADGGPFALLTIAGMRERSYTAFDAYGGRTESCTIGAAGAMVCRGDHSKTQFWTTHAPLPGTPTVLRVGVGGLCAAVDGRIYCRGRGGVLGYRAGAIEFEKKS
jgi:hypothetical protein